jgi:hypothetical protein
MWPESEPNCSSETPLQVKELDDVRMRCDVRYHGNWAPVIQWQDSFGRTLVNSTVVVENTLVTSQLVFKAKVSDHGAAYRCVSKFDTNPELEETAVRNIPNYHASHV